MSHIVEAHTSITYPDVPHFLATLQEGGVSAVQQLPVIALLSQAVRVVSQRYQGRIEPYYLDYDGQRHTVNTGLALHIPAQEGKRQALVRGIGLRIHEETGALLFVGDPYRVHALYQQVQQQIVQTYVGLAAMAVMRQRNYVQVASQLLEERLLVSGVPDEA